MLPNGIVITNLSISGTKRFITSMLYETPSGSAAKSLIIIVIRPQPIPKMILPRPVIGLVT